MVTRSNELFAPKLFAPKLFEPKVFAPKREPQMLDAEYKDNG